jgi:SAM-dependent methyltransferase
MYQKSQKYYDITYSLRYQKESEVVRKLLNTYNPNYKTYLDVACGTGGHGEHLCRYYEVDGIDIQPDFIEIAKTKNPKGKYVVADMTAFDLKKKYDVLSCFYSSIGYVRTKENLLRTLHCFKQHLNDGGVILIEPWATPESWKPGQIRTLKIEADGVSVCRMSETETKGDLTHVTFHYLIGQNGKVEYFTERHEMALFSVQDFKSAFTKAGLEAEYFPSFEGLANRGLYVAKKK